jgi:hypothetical protein
MFLYCRLSVNRAGKERTQEDDMHSAKEVLAGIAVGACLVASIAAVVAVSKQTTARFDEVTVGRINIVEPDGTIRLVISNRTQFPGSFIRGEEIARPDRPPQAGMLFLNDEGTENGGFAYRGQLDADGQPAADFTLTFDRFRQDQMLQLTHEESDGMSTAAIVISDRPDYRTFSVADLVNMVTQADKLPAAERDALIQKHRDAGHFGYPRAYFGTQRHGAAALILRDAKGRPRLRLAVAADGTPAVELLDEDGRVSKSL